MKHSLKDWFFTTRPWSFPASAMPVLASFAYTSWVCSQNGVSVDWVNGVLAIVGIVFFHASGNMMSDIRDFKKGVDRGLAHMPLVNGSFTTKEYLGLSSVLFVFGCLLGFYIMSRCGWPLLYAAVCGAFFTLTYATFKYSALGDLVIFLSYSVIPRSGTGIAHRTYHRSHTSCQQPPRHQVGPRGWHTHCSHAHREECFAEALCLRGTLSLSAHLGDRAMRMAALV